MDTQDNDSSQDESGENEINAIPVISTDGTNSYCFKTSRDVILDSNGNNNGESVNLQRNFEPVNDSASDGDKSLNAHYCADHDLVSELKSPRKILSDSDDMESIFSKTTESESEDNFVGRNSSGRIIYGPVQMDGVWVDYDDFEPIFDRKVEFSNLMESGSVMEFPPISESSEGVVIPPPLAFADNSVKCSAVENLSKSDAICQKFQDNSGVFQFPRVVKKDYEFKLASLACKQMGLADAKNPNCGKTKTTTPVHELDENSDLNKDFKNTHGMGDNFMTCDSDSSYKENNAIQILKKQKSQPGEERCAQQMNTPGMLKAQNEFLEQNESANTTETENLLMRKAKKKEDKYRSIHETWIRPEVIKARQKLLRANEENKKYRREQQILHPGCIQEHHKKISQKAINYRKSYSGFFEVQNALGSSSEFSEMDDYVDKQVRPDSSTSPFDLDTDDVNPGEKALFDQCAEYERKKIQIVQKKKPKSQDKQSNKGQTDQGNDMNWSPIILPTRVSTEKKDTNEELRKVIYPDYRTHTGMKSMPTPILSELKKRSIPFAHQPDAIARFEAARVSCRRPLCEDEYRTSINYKLYAETPESYRKMMGIIPNRNKKLLSKQITVPMKTFIPIKTNMAQTMDFPFKPSSVPKLPPIHGTNNKQVDDYPSSICSQETFKPQYGNGVQTKVQPMKIFRRPINQHLQPIWVKPESQHKYKPNSLRMPLEDGSVQYWRPRQNVSWMHEKVICSSAMGEGRRNTEEKCCAVSACPQFENIPSNNLRSSNKVRPLTIEERKAKRLEDMGRKFEAQKRVVKFVAPSADLDTEYPQVRQEQIQLGKDDILAKISYIQYDFKTVKEQMKNKKFKGHIIVRIIRLGPGTQFQEGLVPGVLAWARYGKGQRLKACFMADGVDLFIYQLEHLSYFYNDENDDVEMPSICAPKKN